MNLAPGSLKAKTTKQVTIESREDEKFEVRVNDLVMFIGNLADCQLVAAQHGPYKEGVKPSRAMWQWMQQ